jgi:hypothetical protein
MTITKYWQNKKQQKTNLEHRRKLATRRAPVRAEVESDNFTVEMTSWYRRVLVAVQLLHNHR